MKARFFVTAALAAAPVFSPSGAVVTPVTLDLEPAVLSIGGTAYGAMFGTDMPGLTGGKEQHSFTGAADGWLKLSRDYDSGLGLSLNASFEVLRDRLSYDNYGGNFVQTVYAQAQTGLGTIKMGMVDGAVASLATVGPVVDPVSSLDNPNASFFLDPATGQAFGELFQISSAASSSLNYVKFAYFTPRIMGLALGVSYTPAESRMVVPFLNNGPHEPNRQKSIWEMAASYIETGENWTLEVYGGALFAHGDGKGTEDASLTDYSGGTEFTYTIDDDWKWALGGGYRHANTFAFDIYQARNTGGTESTHLSSTLSFRDFSVGGEYGHGIADGGAAGPKLGLTAWQLQFGYTIDANWQLTTGWQDLTYSRNTGTFYDGSQRLGMSAGYVHLTFKVGP